MKADTLSTLGAFAIVAALIGGVIGYKEIQTNHLKDRVDRIDASTSEIFNSHASCRQAKYHAMTCTDSWDEAAKIANGIATRLRYKNQNSCLSNHPVCNSRREVVGKILVTGYYPPVIGWQALSSDISIAVPLYSSNSVGYAIHNNGRALEYVRFPR